MTYRFGGYELDDSKRELRRGGVLVDTEPKAFELLLYLLKNRDRAVSKDELQRELWPRTIVTEAALTRCVMKARRAVAGNADHAGKQSVIRTLHGHGYRFVAELEGDGAEDAPAGPVVAPVENAASAAPPRRSPRYLLAAAITLIVLIAVGTIATRTKPATANVGALAVLPVGNLLGDENLDWVRLGLMSLLKRMLEDGGVEVAAENAIVRVIGDADVPGPPDEAWLTRIRLESNAGAVLSTTLDRHGGLYRLAATITHLDGQRTRRVIVGDSPASLAADIARVVTGIVSGAEPRLADRFSKVSTDPFVNQLYARALDMELRGEYEEARSMFELAASQEPDLFWLRYEIALCTRHLREWDDASAMFDELYAEAKSGNDRRALFATLNALGVTGFLRSDYDSAERYFREAQAVPASDISATDRATVYINLALIARRRGDTERAKIHYDDALAEYGGAGIEPSPIFHNNYAGLLLSLGDLDTAKAHSERAVEGFRLRGQRNYEATSLNRLATILRRLGDLEGGIARHEQAIAIYEDIGDSRGELVVKSAMTGAYRENGDLTRARTNADEVKERTATLDDRGLRADAFMEAAKVESDFGNHNAAIADFTSARTTYESLDENMGSRSADFGIAESAMAIGDFTRATKIAEALYDSASDAGDPGTVARVELLLGKIEMAGGSHGQSKDHHSTALAYARTNNDDALLIEAASSLAALNIELGELDAASASLEEIRSRAASQYDFQRLDARLAYARGQKEKALNIMTALRARVGEAWRPEDDALLAELEGNDGNPGS